MIPVIKLESVSKSYFKGSVEIPALQDISMEIFSGEFVSIAGRSGSGKSTLLNIIGGLDSATSGDVWISGNNLTDMSRQELALHRRHTVGMIFQSFNLIPSRTAQDNVSLALAFAGIPGKQRKTISRKLISDLGLKKRINHKPGELSGGEAQRIAVARALANNPRILLADEPTGNLDSITAGEIIGLLEDLNSSQKITVLMVTHEEDYAKTFSHRVIHLKDGRISRTEKLRELQ
jgi:putative ABC transport system ATP-binding protein